MANIGARGFLTLAGVMAILLFGMVWFDLARFTALLGPVAPSPLAAATLRADTGGFFATWAIGALAAAWFNDRRYALLPMLLLGLAFAGRLYTFALTGDAAIVQPMLVEAVLCIAIGIARMALGHGR